jgi:hypothetical protein
MLWIKCGGTVTEFKFLLLYFAALSTSGETRDHFVWKKELAPYSFMVTSIIVPCDYRNGIGNEQE